MKRVGEDALGCAHLDHVAAPEDHGSVADVVAEVEIVSDEEDAESARLEIAEQVQNVDPRRGVEHADDLVRDEEADVEQERARNQHALELASAQLVGILVENFGRVEADDLQRPLELRLPLRGSQPGEVLVAEHLEHVVGLEDRVVRAERILEDALHVAVVLLQLSPAER